MLILTYKPLKVLLQFQNSWDNGKDLWDEFVLEIENEKMQNLGWAALRDFSSSARSQKLNLHRDLHKYLQEAGVDHLALSFLIFEKFTLKK